MGRAPGIVRVLDAPCASPDGAAEIFDDLGVSRVLDVGSGPGKFCVVAGARAPRISFVGIEHRPHLVAAAQSLAAAVGARNVTFIHGDATSLPAADFDGFYVFNSFAENGFSSDDQLDQTVELSHVRRVDDVMRVERWLATRDVGTVLFDLPRPGRPDTGLVRARARRGCRLAHGCAPGERAGLA